MRQAIAGFRLPPIGNRLGLVRLQGGRTVDCRVFADGWLSGFSAWGRPADVQVMPDGALRVSDDKAGVACRITYGSTP
jgi:glucose/arabinose dehydrogenase